MLVLAFSLYHPAPSFIYTLSLHDALPISSQRPHRCDGIGGRLEEGLVGAVTVRHGDSDSSDESFFQSSTDRKSTRLNSSHLGISYAVFCLKKKKQKETTQHNTRRKETLNR